MSYTIHRRLSLRIDRVTKDSSYFGPTRNTSSICDPPSKQACPAAVPNS